MADIVDLSGCNSLEEQLYKGILALKSAWEATPGASIEGGLIIEYNLDVNRVLTRLILPLLVEIIEQKELTIKVVPIIPVPDLSDPTSPTH